MRHPHPWFRQRPYQWNRWTLLLPLCHLGDAVVLLLTLGFFDLGLTPWCSEMHLRRAAKVARMKRVES